MGVLSAACMKAAWPQQIDTEIRPLFRIVSQRNAGWMLFMPRVTVKMHHALDVIDHLQKRTNNTNTFQ